MNPFSPNVSIPLESNYSVNSENVLSVDFGQNSVEKRSLSSTLALEPLTASFLYLNQQVLPTVKQTLQQFVLTDDFDSQLQIAFGEGCNVGMAKDLVENLTSSDDLPFTVQILPQSQLQGNGAFGNGTLFVSEDLLNSHRLDYAVDVILEELGHFIDSQVNRIDAPGDEGEIFANLVQRHSLNEMQLATLKTEDDHAFLRFNNELIAVEKALPSAGVFQVDSTGKLQIDFLADSGAYRSEMAVFSLAGMEGFKQGSTEFIKEAARRALTSSVLGYTVILDPQEGAKFSGELGEKNLNEGSYKGAKIFSFNPSDRVAMMLVPQGTIQEVFNSPPGVNNKLPLFSLATANPQSVNQLGQLVPGTFGWEDIRADQNTDADYNDIVFQVKGALGNLPDLGGLIASGRDWRNLALAQQITQFASQSVPNVGINLASDTGSSNTDKITNNPEIVGFITNQSGNIEQLQASLNGQNFVDLIAQYQADASFRLTRATLAQINGGTLTDGNYQLTLKATDQFGNQSENVSLSFTLDTSAPQTPGFILNTLFDSAPIGDSQTTYSQINLLGQTDANALVTLTGLGLTATADSSGKFSFNNIALALGSNNLTVNSQDLAGNSSTFTATIQRNATDNSDVVLDWNATLLNAVYEDKTAPPLASRNMAMVQAAVFDTVNSFNNTYKNYHFAGLAPVNASMEAAAASAAYRVLVNLYPKQKTFFDNALTTSLAEIPDGAVEDAGVAFGQTVADDILTLRSNDGSSNNTTYVPGTDPGEWQPTAPTFSSALLPQWGGVTPFALTSGSQFRPDGPPALDSAVYTADFNQVKELGSLNSTTRTAEQTEIAKFWADGTGTFTPPGHWNQIAQNVALQKGNSLLDNARLFALLDISLADAGIAAWDAKYHYNSWRPITAIQKAETDGDADTIADANWQPLLTTPPFPEYVSGHSTFSGAAETILTNLLGDNVGFTINSLGLPGIERQFTSFTAAAEEAGMSRIYGGIHFNSANVDGLATGRNIGSYVLANLLTKDVQPPVIQARLTNDTGSSNTDKITNNPAISGTVTDENAIASFRAKLDNGTFVDVSGTLQNGAFSLDSAKLKEINGNTDLAQGEHILGLEATDSKGNVSTVLNFAFTLDSQLPTITTTEVLDDGVFYDQLPLKGNAEGTGSAIAALSYQFDNGAVTPLTVTETGAFDQTLDVTGLTNGLHTLTLTTQDLAGNSTTRVINIEKRVLATLSVMPGDRLALNLTEQIPDSQNATFSLASDAPLPSGMLEGNGVLVINPSTDEIGTYNFSVIATTDTGNTTQDFRLEVVADPITTTRISGLIANTSEQPLVGVVIELGNLQTLTDATGKFTLEIPGDLPSDTLKIRGEGITGNVTYPFIAEKLPLLLGRDPLTGVNNVIARPIYLPPIDMGNAVTIDPNADTNVTTDNIPGASVFVAAGTIQNPAGEAYTGQLSITTVPTELTPAALPPNLLPGLVVTIQPGEMRFNTPAPLSLPNLAGYAPGTVMDLWSINPQTGLFDNVGKGQVSDDGTVINTIEGGIRNSSWHFFAPPPPTPNNPDENDRNPDDACDDCKASAPGTSEVELHSGAVIETHDLVAYQSLGVNRGISLTYDSERADARPILHFGYNNVVADPNLRLMGELTIRRGDFQYQVPGFAGGQYGLNGGEHLWSIPQGGTIDAALQADMRSLGSGRYDYELTTGLLRLNNDTFTGSTSNQTGKFLHVNSIGSIFGDGWGLSGLEEIVENSDGSILLINGDGSELLFEALAGGGYNSPRSDFSTLEKLEDGTFRRTLKDQTVYLFNAQNQLATVRDRVGNETRYLYDDRGNLSQMIDPVGLVTNFVYTGNRVTQIVDPAGRITQLTYDRVGNLIRITDPDNSQRTWEYDAEHHMTAETDKRGNHEQMFYDFAGRADRAIRKDGSTLDFDPVQVQGLYPVSQTTDPLNAPAAFQLGAVESVYVDANGNKVTTLLDKAGQKVSASDEVGVLPSVVRNQENLVTRSTDGRGNVTAFTYDTQGNVLSLQDSLSFGGQFIDISQTGIPVPNINGTDDTSTLVNLPFAFNFYGQNYDQIGVSSNGLISFGGTNSSYTNVPIDANGSGLNNLPSLLPFWDDLETRSNEGYIATAYTQTLGQTGSRQFIIQWHQVEAYSFGSETGDITFQVILTEGTNSVEFNYLDVHFSGNTDLNHGEGLSATVGFWNSASQFQQYSYNEAKLRDGLSLIVTEGGILEGNGSGNGTGARRFTYDPKFNKLTSMTDELGHQMLYEIDANNGNVLSTTQVVGEVGGDDDLISRFTYTVNGLLDTATDPLGRITDNDYDAFGRLITVTYAKGTTDQATRRFEYDQAGNQTVVIDENGNITHFEYDSLNRLTKVIEADPDGVGPLTAPITTYAYDGDGNLVSTTDALGRVNTNQYDNLNRLIKNTDALNQITTYSYDAIGNLLSVIDPLGHKTENVYDDRDRLIKTIAPDGGISQFSYDLDNNLISVIDPVNNQTTFAYDARSRLVRETDALGKATQYQYDAVNNLITKIDRNDRRTDFTYDDLNRVLKEAWVGTDQAINYSYDKASNLTAVTDKYSALAYSYDNRDRRLSENNTGTPNSPSVVLNYHYDAAGNLLSMGDTINGVTAGTNAYSYDALNRLSQLTQSGSNISDKRVNFAYNVLGQYTSVDRYSDLTGTQLVNRTNYSYDNLNRLTSLGHSNGTNNVAFYNYAYDAASRITQITDIDGVTDYTYDNRSQLTGANHSDTNNPDESYTYDANGNRTNSTVHGDGYQTGVGNRLTSDGIYNYEYDNEGNLSKQTEIATGKVQELTWDYRNRLVAIIDKDAAGNETQRVEFTYDALNRRIAKAVDANPQDTTAAIVTQFVYDGEDVLLEFVDSDGVAGANQPVLTQRYLHGAGVDQVLAQESSGNVVWQLTDHLGTVRDLVNDSGAVVNHFVYDSYGQVISETNPAVDTRYLFTGREFDQEIGLYYYRARYYDQTTGRFLGEDPIRFKSGEVNLYRYALNSPTKFNDPSGKLAFVIPLIPPAVVAAAEALAYAAALAAAAALAIDAAIRAAKAREICKADCDAQYSSDVERCKKLPCARERAICYAEAAQKYATCLARC